MTALNDKLRYYIAQRAIPTENDVTRHNCT